MKRAAVSLLLSLALTTAAAGQIDWEAGVVYEYDGSGNVKTIGSDTYRYDTAQRLIRGTVAGSQQDYEYDSFGNRTACQTPAGADCQYGFTIDSATNRLANRSYDNRGNLTQLPEGNTLEYDELGMLRKETGNGRVAYYIYTADDERIAVYEADTTANTHKWRWTVRGLDKKPLREFTSETPSGTVNFQWSKDYVWRDSVLLASRQLESNGSVSTYHYHADHLGTPRLVTNASGVTIGRHDYLPFGPELPGNATEAQQQNVKFTGHERDVARDRPPLDYMHARYYEARLGRFLSVDPTLDSADLGKPQSWNRYAYVMNNPVNMTDLDGRMPFVFQVLVELATDFVTDGSPTGPSAAQPPRSQAEFEQRVAVGLAFRTTTYQTYTKMNPETGEVYSGRTSGTGTPEQNIARRDAGHHKNREGYGPAQLDKSSTNKDAIRGREQQLIDANGRARSRGGTSGNAVNSISEKNPKKSKYLKEAAEEFGQFLKKLFL